MLRHRSSCPPACRPSAVSAVARKIRTACLSADAVNGGRPSAMSPSAASASSFNVGRNCVCDLAEPNHAGTDAVQVSRAFPCAIHEPLGCGRCNRGPKSSMIDDTRGRPRIGRPLSDALTKGDQRCLLSWASPLGARGICWAARQRPHPVSIRTLARLLLAGSKPCVGQTIFELDIPRVTFCVDIGGVDAAEYFGDRKGPECSR